MAKRPSFQFYPGDWMSNTNLRRCSPEARGYWMDILCLMHDSMQYGVLRWPLEDIQRAIGCPAEILQELITKGVLKGAPMGGIGDALIYTPTHGRRKMDPVTLIEAQAGPIWYSSRMVVDEYNRQNRGQHGIKGHPDHIGNASNISPMPPIGESIDEGIGESNKPPIDAPPSSSSSSSSNGFINNSAADGETEKTQKVTSKAGTDRQYLKEHEVFYQAYPNKRSKGASERAFIKVRRSGVELSTLLEGIESYKKSKPAYADWKYPATWLNGKCWLDEASPSGVVSAPRSSGGGTAVPGNLILGSEKRQGGYGRL